MTSRENTLRGRTPAAANAAKTHCPRNHELTGGNLVAAQLARGWRECVTCRRIGQRASDTRRRGLARLRAEWDAGAFAAPGGDELVDALHREHVRRVDALQAEWFEAAAGSSSP